MAGSPGLFTRSLGDAPLLTTMRILFLSAWFPFPPNNGSRIRIYNLLRGLAEQHEIHLISFADQPDVNPDTPEVRRLCADIQVVPLKSFTPDSWGARLGFLHPTPRSVLDTWSPEMDACIREKVAATDFDLAVASQTRMAGYRDAFAGLPAVFEEVEISLIYEDFATAVSLKQRARYGLTWWKHRRYLDGLLRRFQASTVASEQERQRLVSVLPQNGRPMAVIPNCLDVAAYASAIAEPQPNTLIYTGSFGYFPNHEAMLWFIREVLPLVQAEIPDAQLTITGNRAGKNLPDAPGVRHVGFVDDVRQYVASSWISLAPIWSGGGTRLKILEAMALRVPVIATSKGAEGIDAVPGEHILVADTAVDFAVKTIDLLKNETLRRKLTDNAYHLVCEKYDWTAVVPQLSDLLEQITHEND